MLQYAILTFESSLGLFAGNDLVEAGLDHEQLHAGAHHKHSGSDECQPTPKLAHEMRWTEVGDVSL